MVGLTSEWKRPVTRRSGVRETKQGLVQTPEGVLLLTNFMLDLVERANECGDKEKAAKAESVCARFMADHPLTH